MSPIPGVTFEAICKSFEDSYDRDTLEDMLRKRISVRLADMTGPNTVWLKAVSDVVTWSEKQGRLTELIRAGYNYKPTHPSMQALYEKYGMATEASLQQGGQTAQTL